MNQPPQPAKPERLDGFDLARSLAILGMIIVHFTLVMTSDVAPVAWSETMLGILDGRPAATFVIVAGIGVSLMSRKGLQGTQEDRKSITAVLQRRGLFLLVLGFINFTIWQGDILRVYGISLLLIPWVVWKTTRTLLLSGLGFAAGFCVLLSMFDYDQNWDWDTLTYHGAWTLSGLVRNLFYDGFRSVIPWTGLLILGVWLGRLDWSSPRVPRSAMKWGTAIAVSSWALSAGSLHWLGAHPQPDLDQESAVALFGLKSMPPMPLFLLNAIGCSLLIIGASTLLAARWKHRLPVRALCATGRMAFTWYVAHIILGLGGLILLGWTQASHLQAAAASITFFVVATVISLWWTKRFSHGPFEYALRRIGGR